MTRVSVASALRRLLRERRQWPGRLVHALGCVAPAAWIVVAATSAVGVYYLLAVAPIEEQVRELRRQATALGGAPGSSAPTDDPAERLAAFYASLPDPGGIPDAMQALFDAAQAEGLVQDQGSYRLERRSGDRFVRYRIELPLRGTYPQLRRFLAKAITALPSLAVDDIQFSRAQVADALVDCRLAMTLYLVDRSPAQ